MEWIDEGIVIGVRRHGESNAVVELMTQARGRHLGLVRGGLSRRQAPFLQPGNKVRAVWRARVSEQLGAFSIEPLEERAGGLMAAAHGVFGVTYMAALLHLLPERDPYPGLYKVLDAILDAFADPMAAGELLARFELALLGELGFGLELERCAATGGNNNLVFVSPRTGRAVSEDAGAPYAELLLPLPSFLVGSIIPPSVPDLEDAFRLTGYFLARRVLEPRGLTLPEARSGFLAAIRRAGRSR